MRWKRFVLGIGIVLIVGSVGGWMLFKNDEKPVSANVVTTEVRKGLLEVRITGTGNIEPAEREIVKIATVGKVDRVHVREGDVIQKGDLLLTFEQDDIEAQIRNKELDLQKQELDLEQLQLQYQQAAAVQADSQDALKVNILKAQLNIKQVKEDIATLREKRAIDPISAPISGKIVSLDIREGDSINQNTQIAEIVDYDNMKMVVRVDELDIAKVKLDQAAELLVEALPGKVYPGKVVEIADEGAVQNGVATFNVTILLTDIDGLKAGMSAEASILTAKKEDALYLPIEAVQSVRNQYFVMVPGGEDGEQRGEGQQSRQRQEIRQNERAQQGQGRAQQEQGRVRTQGQSGGQQSAQMRGPGGGAGTSSGVGGDMTRVPVEIGLHTEDNVEIVSGLKEGDIVIVPAGASRQQNSNAGAGNNFRGGGFGGGIPRIPGGGGGFPGGGVIVR